MSEILKLAVIISAANQFGNAFSKATEGLKGVTAATAGVAAGFAAAAPAIAVFAGTMAVDFVQSTIQMAMTFEKEMLRVQAVSQVTGEGFQKLTDFALELGRTTIFTAQQSAEAMTTFSMAGFSELELYEAVPVAIDLATASMTEMGVSAGVTANILRAFSMETSETTRVGDVLTQTFTNTYANLEDLLNTFKTAAPLAKAAGLSFEETATAAGLLANAGLKGTLAGTGIRQTLTKLLKPTSEAWETIQRLRLEIHIFSEEGDRMNERLGILSTSMDATKQAVAGLAFAHVGLNLAVKETALEIAKNDLAVNMLESAISRISDSSTELNETISTLGEEFSSLNSEYQTIGTRLSIVNTKITIHEDRLEKINASYTEWTGELDKLEEKLSIVEEELDKVSTTMKINNIEIRTHENIIKDAMAGYTEWTGDINKLKMQIEELDSKLRKFSIAQKNNQIEIMTIRQNADRVGRKLALEEETRINFISEKNDELAIKQLKSTVLRMEAQDKLSDEEKKAADINAKMMEDIMNGISSHIAAVEQLKKQNEELMLVEGQINLRKIEMLQNLREEEIKVAEENMKRAEISKAATAEEMAILEGLRVTQEALTLSQREYNVERLETSLMLIDSEKQKEAYMKVSAATEVAAIEAIRAANQELYIVRQEQSLAVQESSFVMDTLSYSIQAQQEEFNKLTETIIYEIEGVKSLYEVLTQLEEKMVTSSEMITIFGTRGGTAMVSLLNLGSAAFKELSDKIYNSQGRLEEVRDIIYGSFSVSLDILKSKFDEMKIQLGMSLLPELQNLVAVIYDLIPLIAFELHRAFEMVMMVLAPFIELGKVILYDIFQPLSDALGINTEHWMTFVKVLFFVSNPILWIAWALVGVAKVIGWFIDFAIVPCIEAYKEMWYAIDEWVLFPFEVLKADVMYLWNYVLKPFADWIVEDLTMGWKWLSDGVSGFIDVLLELVELYTPIGRLYKHVLKPIFEGLSNLHKSIPHDKWREGGIMTVGTTLGVKLPEEAVKSAEESMENRKREREKGKLSEEMKLLDKEEEITKRKQEGILDIEDSQESTKAIDDYYKSLTARGMMSGGEGSDLFGSAYEGAGFSTRGETVNISIGEMYIYANSEEEGRMAVKGVMEELKSLKLRGMAGGA